MTYIVSFIGIKYQIVVLILDTSCVHQYKISIKEKFKEKIAAVKADGVV